MAIRSFLYTNLQSKTQCVGFFTLTYRRAVIFTRSQVSISVLFPKVCQGWKLSPIINRWGGWGEVWYMNVLSGKKSKNN